MKARVHITRKTGVLDPEGKAIAQALDRMGFDGVSDVRKGTYLELDLTGMDRKKAEEAADEMCRTLLANTVIENYTIAIEE